MNEWLVIDKIGDHIYFKNQLEICKYFDLTKAQVYNIYNQSLKHYNKYTNSGLYIQRLFNDNSRTPRKNFSLNKFIYYVNDDGSNQYGILFDKL